ncbi:MAG: hypothetical protein M1816_006309 [Peltula sp. TS41687]|nr:MAG: hypothetical protein M1816_006309 [Peltula sp. TS41687]
MGTTIRSEARTLFNGDQPYRENFPPSRHTFQISSNLHEPQGTAGNLGMYASGIPIGILIDARGPRFAVILGALCLGIGYYPIYGDEGNPHIESRQLRPSKSFERRRPDMDQGSYESSSNMNEAVQHPHESQGLDRGNHGVVHDRFKVSKQNLDENSSLMSDSPISNQPSNAHFLQEHSRSHVENSRMQPPDVRGLALLIKEEFWYLFSLLGILAGIGLMTINNVGNDTQALWSHYDDSVSQKFIQKRQFVHVSLISLSSFTGRLSSGVGSDIIKKMLGMSRYWCVTLAAVVFAAAQICAIRIENPHHLSQKHSAFMAYLKRTVYDHHSSILPSGERDCSEGLYCYRTAYWVTFIGSLLALCVSLWGIHRERERERERERGSKKVNVNLEHHDGDV